MVETLDSRIRLCRCWIPSLNTTIDTLHSWTGAQRIFVNNRAKTSRIDIVVATQRAWNPGGGERRPQQSERGMPGEVEEDHSKASVECRAELKKITAKQA